MFATNAPTAAPHSVAGHDASHDHAHSGGGGRCTSWVDEALDAAGPEYADVPRPGSCCEKDAREAKEAARVRRIVSAADPAARAAALRAASNPANVLAMPCPLRSHREGDDNDRDEDSDEDSDGLLTDSDDDTRMMPTLDPVLLELQERRLREMKAAAARAAANAAKSSYTSAKETDLPKSIAEAPSRVVLHFPLEGSDESARIDEVLDGLAPGFPRTRFIRVRAGPLGGGSLHSSPMLTALGASTLPALVCFRRRRISRWTAGLDDFGGVEGFDEDRVVRWLATAGDALPGHPMAPRPPGHSGTRDGRDAGGGEGDRVYSSDEDEQQRGGGGGHLRQRGGDSRDGGYESDGGEGEDGGDGGGDSGAYHGAGGEPCAQCGRRYPHQHIRALRHGDGGGKRGSDDDDDSD